MKEAGKKKRQIVDVILFANDSHPVGKA